MVEHPVSASDIHLHCRVSGVLPTYLPVVTQADFSSTDPFDNLSQTLMLGPGAVSLDGLAKPVDRRLLFALNDLLLVSPFRHMSTPGGWRMSVAMTNCGEAGWVADSNGYRYDPVDPDIRRAWPDMPDVFLELAVRASELAGYPGFMPDACLVNRYVPGARRSLHHDRDERHFEAPTVSVSPGLPAVFLWGGLSRHDKP